MNAPKERPILFSAPMVRALLDGSKTQTRRIVKLTNRETENPEYGFFPSCPYGQPGDRLWVREAWQFYDWSEDGDPLIRFAADNATTWPRVPIDKADQVENMWAALSAPENFNIDNRARDRKWRPSIHMPRWASRILLEIVSVRIERLQDISEDDARAEGITDGGCINCGDPEPCKCTMPMPDARESYCNLWESLNGIGSWNANPWVWVIEVKRVQP